MLSDEICLWMFCTDAEDEADDCGWGIQEWPAEAETASEGFMYGLLELMCPEKVLAKMLVYEPIDARKE